MAVLTPIDLADVAALAPAYGLPAPARLEGIAGGSVNSNFVFEADGRRVFLRLYEERDRAGAVREAELLCALAAAGVPTPAPLPRLDGAYVSGVRGKPAALFPWRDGGIRCQAAVTVEDARRVGEALARVHVAGASVVAEPSRFGAPELRARLDLIERSGHALAVEAPGLRRDLERVHAARDPGLPCGLTHGDLFRDNVLWSARGELSALLDFESACHGPLAYDLMVTVLSWCFGDDLDAGLASAMREGYEQVRALTGAEKEGLLSEGQMAAMRFTITRITDYAMRVTEGPRVAKDWRRFRRRFERLESLGRDGLARVLAL